MLISKKKKKKMEIAVKLRLTSIGIYLFEVDNGKTRAMCEICSKLTKETTERQ